MSERSTVVVVGAGLAGLSAAVALARTGLQVTLLEASEAPGGCCSTSRVEGYTFNNGALYVAVPSALRAAFLKLGMDLDTEVPMVPIRHPHLTVLGSGTSVHLSSVEGSFVEGDQAQKRTAALRTQLHTLREQWAPIYRALVRDILPSEPSIPRLLFKLWRHLPKMGGSAGELIAAKFDDPEVQAAVASVLLYTGTAPARLPATQIVGLLALLEEGFHIPADGMGAIPAALLRAAVALPVSVRFGARVERFAISQGRVRGVELSSGETIPADNIVATCSGFDVVRRMLPETAVPAALVRRAKRSPLSHRAIAIQIGADSIEGDTFIVNHVPAMNEQGALHVARPGVPRWLSYTNPTAVLPHLAPEGNSIIELYAPVSGIASASQWTKAMTEQSVADYIQGLRQRLPTLAIKSTRVLDPQDFASQRNLYEGALYGIAPGATPGQFFPHRLPIDGLYLAGQTTFPGYGVPTAMWSGIQAAEALLRDTGLDKRTSRLDAS